MYAVKAFVKLVNTNIGNVFTSTAKHGVRMNNHYKESTDLEVKKGISSPIAGLVYQPVSIKKLLILLKTQITSQPTQEHDSCITKVASFLNEALC